MASPFPPSAPVEFASVRPGMLTLSVSGERHGHLVVLFSDLRSTRRALRAFYAVPPRLSDTLRAIGAVTVASLDLDLGLASGGDGVPRSARPYAVMATTRRGDASATEVEDCVLAALSGDPRPMGSPFPEPAPAIPDGPVPAATHVAAWTSPTGHPVHLLRIEEGGERMLGVLREGSPQATIVLSESEMPDLLRGIALAFPGTHRRAGPVEGGTGPSDARAALHRACDAMMGRLFAAYPDALDAESLDDSVSAMGMSNGIGILARSELRKAGKVTLREGLYVLKP